MRRWYAALGVAILCLFCTVGASSSDVAASRPGAPRLLSATAAIARPMVTADASAQAPTPAFGSYAVIGFETLIAAALLCYACLQRRRATTVRLRHGPVRLRGPPLLRDNILLTP
jgi:hypothetical protein